MHSIPLKRFFKLTSIDRHMLINSLPQLEQWFGKLLTYVICIGKQAFLYNEFLEMQLPVEKIYTF